MTKSNKAQETARKAVVSKNPSDLKFEMAPFYNLANVRKAAISLIVRSSSDPAKVAAIKETLDVLSEFLDVRAEHGAAVLEATVAANDAAEARRSAEAAQWREADAEALLRDSEANAKRAKGILAKLRGKAE